MVSFRFEPWRTDTEIEVRGETYCFELRDKEHCVKAYLREFNGRSTTTLIISLQKKEGYEEYVKKMLELVASGASLDDHKRMFLIYKSAEALFAGGSRVDVYAEWEEEGMKMHTKAVLDKNRVYVLFKALEGPHELFYQVDAEAGANIEEQHRMLRHFLANAVVLHRLFKEYAKGRPTGQ
jgi:hypothetical protein